MPIKIPNSLPAYSTLESENIFVMTETRALHQDIRPLKLLILNLMPTKIVTETQILRCLSNTPLQIEVEFLTTTSYISKNTPESHLLSFYTTFDKVINNLYDGMIITGAPVEHLPFEEVAYWDELCSIMDWTCTNVYSTFHICWGAQAGLYHHYKIPKYPLNKKMFGIFEHKTLDKTAPIFRGFDDCFNVPHSRHTEILEKDIINVNELKLLSVSDRSGVFAACSHDGRQIFITGHPEYDAETLSLEYYRDLENGLTIDIPENYFPDNNPSNKPQLTWRSHGNLLYTNWLNYYVYQSTPYNLNELK